MPGMIQSLTAQIKLPGIQQTCAKLGNDINVMESDVSSQKELCYTDGGAEIKTTGNAYKTCGHPVYHNCPNVRPIRTGMKTT